MNSEERWSRFRYLPNKPLYADGSRATASAAHLKLSEEAAGEGIVLLKNEGLLPLKKGTRVALFGKGTFDYVKGGGGSGDVTVSHTINIYDGLMAFPDDVTVSGATIPFYRDYVEKELAGGTLPGLVAEPALPQKMLKQAANEADVAVICISRYSGEGWDRKMDRSVGAPYSDFTKGEHQSARVFERGDFYLSNAERTLVEQVKKNFRRIVVLLNVGGIVESGWFAGEKKIGAALLIGQGGMCGGLAAAKALIGAICPSGKLVDTWAGVITDYPSTKGFFRSDAYVEYEEDIYVGYRYFSTIKGAVDAVVYPFGFGLSYTTFSLEEARITKKGDRMEALVAVTNTGAVPGREVVQLYAEAPQGRLGKPARELKAFTKTRLLAPGETQRLFLTVKIDDLASYDDLGIVKQSAWVLEKGEYAFYLGTSVSSAQKLETTLKVTGDRVVRQLSRKLAPTALKRRLTASGKYEKLPVTPQKKDRGPLPVLKLADWDGFQPGERAEAARFIYDPKSPFRQLRDVAEGKVSLSAFMKQLTDEDLCWMFGGQPNTGVANTWGLGNNRRLGIPNVMTADGPAGFRTLPQTGVVATAWPVAVTLASTWDPDLLRRVGEAAAKEVKENNIGVWLAPALNIHRSPLCGRNFEYFSEDPFVSGKMAAAVVEGVQSQHIAATVKHFAFNNKETNRRESDSRVSERAAREIYLKAFEMVVTQAKPWCVMASYNIVNGVHTSENRELLTDILRGEWGFDGLIMTDWWSTGDPYRDLLAGIDLRMPYGVPERMVLALKKRLISRSDLERAAKRQLELILKLD
ncbi:MAG: glycoside hydrolase family 3 C-terminal domain-containing protein [Lachnospiraceae bacterium]|nr:glycoside hydrolase family 3 C-terminal domain-containing protein [Lachnospiraceae bacterium]